MALCHQGEREATRGMALCYQGEREATRGMALCHQGERGPFRRPLLSSPQPLSSSSSVVMSMAGIRER
jgi:hypothetical protein